MKFIRSLCADGRVRRSERMFVVEGVRLAQTALDSGAIPLEGLFDPEQLARTAEGFALLRRLQTGPCQAASPKALAAAADTVNPQGIVAAFAWPTPPARTGLILVLDQIQDPGNLGTLLRSAEAAGASRTICGPGCADPYSPKVVRAAMGAHFYLPIVSMPDWAAIGAELPPNAPVYAATAEAAQAYTTVPWPQAAALMIGSEAHGLSPEAAALATQFVAIPMLGRAESLNAGVAGSILLFEALRQRAI